jgi:hypothetical protein
MSEPPLPSARRQLLFSKYGPILITPFFFGFSTHVLAPNSFSRFDIIQNKKPKKKTQLIHFFLFH